MNNISEILFNCFILVYISRVTWQNIEYSSLAVGLELIHTKNNVVSCYQMEHVMINYKYVQVNYLLCSHETKTIKYLCAIINYVVMIYWCLELVVNSFIPSDKRVVNFYSFLIYKREKLYIALYIALCIVIY